MQRKTEMLLSLKSGDCTLCPDLVQSRTRIVTDRGNPKSSLLIVGQSPGVAEDKSGIPFVGLSGRLLTRAIEDAGYDPEKDVYYFNAVLCHVENNARPSEEHISNCSRYLSVVVSEFKHVLCLGSVASYAVLRLLEPIYSVKTAVSNGVDSISMDKLVNKSPLIGDMLGFGKKTVYFYYHPAYLLRKTGDTQSVLQSQEYKDFVSAIKRILSASKGSSSQTTIIKGLF